MQTQTIILPTNSPRRLSALKSYKLTRRQNNPNFNNITELASTLTKKPIALISIVDEHDVWIKSAKGMDICTVEKDVSFCNHAVNGDEDILVIEDATIDPRFIGNPYTNNGLNSVIFYAGVSLTDKNNHKLGTLCVIDNKPNTISEEERNMLTLLAKQTVKLIELNKSNSSLKRTKKKLSNKNKQLKNFAGQVAHDMKMPLANMILTSDIIRSKYENVLDEKGFDYIKNLKNSSMSLSRYINDLLEYYESDTLETMFAPEEFSFMQLLEEVIDILSIKFECLIELPSEDIELKTNRAALEQILLNLIANSLKYNDKDEVIITIDHQKMDDQMIKISVSDNGIGIPKEKQKDIFRLFSTLENTDRYGKKGNGIGLSTVKKLVTKLGGRIAVDSTLGEGTTFSFTLKNHPA